MSQGFAGTVTIKLKSEKVEQFRALATKAAEAMSKEQECKQVLVHTLVDDPTTFFVYEAWSCSYEYFVNELRNKPYRHELNAVLGRMTVEERKVALLDYVASYPG